MSGSRVDPREPYRVYDVDDFLSRTQHSEPDPATGPDLDPSAPVSIERPFVRAPRGRRVVPFLFAAVAAALGIAIKLASLHTSVAPRSGDRPTPAGPRAIARSATAEPTPPSRSHRPSRRPAARSRKPARAVPQMALPTSTGAAAPVSAGPSSPSREFGFER